MTGGSAPLRFGKFLLTSLLARGGMSHVWLGKADGVYGLRRLIVVKKMLPILSQDRRFVGMFLDEARLGSLLQHPSIAQVFEFGQVDDQLFLAMEYVDGVDLRVLQACLRRDGALLPVDLCLYVAGEICRALDFAHRKTDDEGNPLGLVHRDVSPSNVLLSRDGAVKLCDFGIATVVHDAPTVVGTMRGKFSYMSPEQASGQRVDARSDLVSAGIVLWELLEGRHLYRTENEVSTLELARRGVAPQVKREVPSRPALQAILDRLLHRDPVERFQTARDVRLALDEYARASGLAGDRDGLAAVIDRTCASELRRRGQRRDALPVDGDRTPVTPAITGDEPRGAVPPEVVRPEGTRAYVPHGALETVSLPDEFPEVVSRAPVEQPLIIARPARRPSGQAFGAVDRAGATPRRTASTEDRVVQHLETEGLLSRTDLERALAHIEHEHTTLPRALVELGILTESALCHALSEVHGIPTVDLASWSMPQTLADLLPLSQAQARAIVPFRVEKGRGKSVLCVAMSDPDGRLAIAEIEARGEVKARVFLARPSAVSAAIDRLYRGIKRTVPALYPKGMAEPK